MLAAIILAAGKSERMGRSKALLPVGGTTFLGRIVEIYAASAVDRVIVVTRADAEPVPLPPEPPPGKVLTVANPDPRGDQLSSLLAGIAALGPHPPAGVVVHPVDHPLVLSSTVATIVGAARENPRAIVVPVSGGRRGHPVVFPAGTFPALMAMPPGTGARGVLRDRAADVVEIITGDAGILADIDTPEDYERLR